MSNYEVHAKPFFINVSCPSHRNYMVELRNGLFGETLWWCKDCERCYHLKPTMMKIGTFDRQLVDEQLAQIEALKQPKGDTK